MKSQQRSLALSSFYLFRFLFHSPLSLSLSLLLSLSFSHNQPLILIPLLPIDLSAPFSFPLFLLWFSPLPYSMDVFCLYFMHTTQIWNERFLTLSTSESIVDNLSNLSFSFKQILKFNYSIHSNRRPGCLDKSFWVGAYLFQYLLQGLTQKLIILAIIRLIPSYTELSM